HPHQRPGSANRHAVHLRDHRLSTPPLSGRSLRLDHGRGQSAQLPSLATMARHRRDRANDRGRSARAQPLRQRQSCGPLSRAGAVGAAEPISKVRPDAEEILHLVLARLDDMKAEDTVTIDLTGKSSIADMMVVTSGSSNRHVGSIADRVLEDLAAAGLSDDRKSTRLNSSHVKISYAVFCLKKKR